MQRIVIVDDIVQLKLLGSSRVTLFNLNHLWDVLDVSEFWSEYDGYACFSRRVGNKTVTTYLHKLIKGTTSRVDHKDRNKLNNLDHNLRLATQQQNNCNKTINKSCCTSQYRGVSWSKQKRKFKVDIACHGKSYHGGYFIDEVEAAKAYDILAIKYFGEFAVLNFPIKKDCISTED